MKDQLLYVLMPVHNGSKTIERAIDSVFEQKKIDLNYRLCIVLNRCTDNTEDVIKNSKWYEYIDIIKCEIKGIVPALNAGLQYCISKGATIIARQDADDWWHPRKLQAQFDFLESNPDIDICGTSLRYVKSDTYEPVHDMIYPSSHDQCIDWLYQGRNPIAHPSVIYRTHIFSKCGGYDNTFSLAEDLFLWVRAWKNGYRFGNISYPLVDYTHVPNPNYDPNVAVTLKLITKVLKDSIK